MSSCSNCCGGGASLYRIVQTIYQRNTMPCSERVNGMIVTVVGSDSSYKQYMLKGGDPCVNSNWKSYNIVEDILTSIGHVTLVDPVATPVTNGALNARFPEALQGFKVTIPSMNTTFMKIFNNEWLMSNNVKLDNE